MIKFLFFLFNFLILTNYSTAYEFSLKKIADFNAPWGSAFINKDELILTEKKGEIKVINLISKKITKIKHNLDVLVYGQGGLLDIIYKDNHVWVSYSENRGNWETSTSIAKGKFDKKQINFENIFQAEPPIDSGYHFGSRLVIKNDHLYASIGERGMGLSLIHI